MLCQWNKKEEQMSSINNVTLTGNLVADPNLKQTKGGMSILEFSIAVNDSRKNQQTGEWEDYPNYVDCTLFGARAESLSRMLHKGIKVAIMGKLNQSRWQTEEGKTRSKISVIVNMLDFVGQKGDKAMAQKQQQASYNTQEENQQQTAYDIPF